MEMFDLGVRRSQVLLAWSRGRAERGCDRHRTVNIFLAVLNRLTSHFRVRGHMLLLSQDHPLDRVEIDLRQIASHKIPGPATLRLRLLRGGWTSYSMADFRPSEVTALSSLLTRWEKLNHRQPLERTENQLTRE